MPIDTNEIDGLDPISEALSAQGITPEYLAKCLMSELKAVNRMVWKDETTGKTRTKQTTPIWNIRQAARQDAHKLMGHYPAASLNVKHSGVIGLKEALDEMDGSTAGPSTCDED